MTEPFLGEIQLFGFNFAPRGWASCAGETMPLQQNTALYALIGTVYGGNGRQTFQLPNLANRLPCGTGTGIGLTPRDIGETFGENSVTLLSSEMAPHIHALNAYIGGSGAPVATPDAGSALSPPSLITIYGSGAIDTAMAPLAIAPSGGGQPHENRQPMLAINYSIALEGNFPQFP